MEGQSIVTSKYRFTESKVKIVTGENVTNPNTKLVSAANNHGLIIVGCESTKSIKAIPMLQLFDFSKSHGIGQMKHLSEVAFEIQLSFHPTIVTVAKYGFSSVALAIGYNETNTPQAAYIDLDTRSLVKDLELNNLKDSTVIDYAWHPNHPNYIVAICTDKGNLAALAFDTIEKNLSLVYNCSDYRCLTCCWSPKGKNLAIGMENGQVMRLEPVITATSYSFKQVERSAVTLSYERLTSQHRIIKLRWINRYLLFGIHARPGNSPDTVYSMITFKPAKPFRHWTNICFENQPSGGYCVYLANLSNAVICSPCTSSEAAIIGLDGAKEASTSELNDWNGLIIDEEGARIDLPLDSSNTETYSRGLTLASHQTLANPVLVFYTNAGLICSYSAEHSENILKFPECPPLAQEQLQVKAASILTPSAVPRVLQSERKEVQFNEASLNLSKSAETAMFRLGLTKETTANNPGGWNSSIFDGKSSRINLPLNTSNIETQSKSLTLSANQTLTNPMLSFNASNAQARPSGPERPENLVKPPENLAAVREEQQIREATIKMSNEMPNKIQSIKKEVQFNEVFLSMLEDIHYLRENIIELQDLHKLHREALGVFREEIDALDIGVLEDLYLIEYIKSRVKGNCRKKSIDPVTSKKVEQIKLKTKLLADKIKELDLNVEVSWEDFLRRSKNRNPMRLTSLDIVYKTLATNQKIINVLKKKLANQVSPEAVKQKLSNEKFHSSSPNKCQADSAKMKAFRGFLATRCTVPVRQIKRKGKD